MKRVPAVNEVAMPPAAAIMDSFLKASESHNGILAVHEKRGTNAIYSPEEKESEGRKRGKRNREILRERGGSETPTW